MAWKWRWAPPPRVRHDWTKCQGEPLSLPILRAEEKRAEAAEFSFQSSVLKSPTGWGWVESGSGWARRQFCHAYMQFSYPWVNPRKLKLMVNWHVGHIVLYNSSVTQKWATGNNAHNGYSDCLKFYYTGYPDAYCIEYPVRLFTKYIITKNNILSSKCKNRRYLT